MTEKLKKRTVELVLPYIREIAPGHYSSDITVAVNKKFGLDLTEKQIKTLMSNHRIKTGMRGKTKEKHWNQIMTPEIMQWLIEHQYTHNNKDALKELQTLFSPDITNKMIVNWRRKYKLGWRMWTPEMHEFVKSNFMNMSAQTLTEAINEKFGKNFNRATVTAFISYNNYNKGEHWKARKSNRSKPVNTERLRHSSNRVKGYWEVKVSDCPARWRPKSHVMYEKYHPDVTVDAQKYSVVFLDGDVNNFAENNLLLVERRIMGVANSRYKLIKNQPELNKLVCGITTIELLSNENEKKCGDR